MIVIVKAPYFFPREYDGCQWTGFRKPWIVTSLGRPLQYRHTDGTPCAPTQSGVLDDANLQPLDDSDDAPPLANDLDIPIDAYMPPSEHRRVGFTTGCGYNGCSRARKT
ncbi:hypothetical protein [Caenimonas aquaedulcis]|uniref:Uncharacterized protein n=1 Tax=Caenimonas aquaedulcis TaxID=2793270 RepID=A0A931H680_9BURK|nr:hypothetical protein [Caenimonas aquaedulcis]MBG9389336.1 hypothetical protein [Caenimonas aquaedulcis]